MTASLPGLLWDGKKITEPGVYAGIPLQDTRNPADRWPAAYPDYHGDLCADHSVSHGGLERILKSPMHYFDRWYGNPDHEPDEPTEGMVLGRAAHHLFLGERNFQKQFIRRPEEAPDGTGRAWNGNNTSCKEWLERQAAKGLTVIKRDQVDALTRMNRSLAAEPMIKGGILNGHIEQSFVWCDDGTGLWIKARPDVVPNDIGDFADVKLIADISDVGIGRSIYSFGYHRQAALAMEGASKLLGYPMRFRDPGSGEGMSWTLVFIEAKRPHAIEIVTLKDEDLQRAVRSNRLALQLLKRSIDTGDWPGPSGHQKDGRFLGLSKYQADDETYRASQITRQLAIGATTRD